MSMQRFHLAAKAIESDGIGGFRKATEFVDDEVAFALVVAHLRRGYGSMGSWPADPDIDPKVNGLLDGELQAVYSVLSQNPILFYSRRG